ncbi:MAG: hypothetical protein J7474_12375, partial [Arthrobacter sp.]|nr:hypothetical protein [Arthrobacter sp.]
MTTASQPGLSAEVNTEQALFVAAVNERLDDFLDRQRHLVSGISEDVAPLLDSIRTLVSGGKRMRALLAYWGFRAAGGAADEGGDRRADADNGTDATRNLFD